MNLPVIFITASVITSVIWISVIMIVIIVKAITNIKKSIPTLSKQPQPNDNTPHKRNKNNPQCSPKPAAPKKDIVVGRDEAAFTPDEEQDSPLSLTDDTRSQTPKIKIDTPDEMKKAIIYHEILTPKF